MTYIQTLYRGRDLDSAIRRAMLDHPGATWITAEEQYNLFREDTDVFVTMEVPGAVKQR
jgi:HSP20 family molecular chaperone IbpA